MTTEAFSHYLQKLESTASRNEMTIILAELLDKASADEIDKICYLILGELAPNYQRLQINLAEKMMVKILAFSFNKNEQDIQLLFKEKGDFGNIAYDLKQKKKEEVLVLSVTELYNRLVTIAGQGGLGSQDRKIKLFAELIDAVDAAMTKFLVRMPIGKLRLGFSNVTILDALSWTAKGDKSLRPAIENGFNVCADIGLIAKTFKKGGVAAVKKISPKLGIPIRPALTERLPTVEKIFEKMGQPALEPKYDGFRVQIHFTKNHSSKNADHSLLFNQQKGSVNIFSRQMDNTTEMFPEIAAAAKTLPVSSVILDGEAIGINIKTGHFLPFQETAQRKRKYDIVQTAKNIPLKVFVFDVLYLDGVPLLTKPFYQRRKILEKVLEKMPKGSVINLTPQAIVKTKKEFEKLFDKFVANGLEGVVCKKLTGIYRAGKRDFNWVKYKKAMQTHLIDTVDCVVMGYYKGKGKRSKFGIGAFLVGIWDKNKKEFLTIAKIGTGLTDDQWREIRKKVDDLKTEDKPKEYTVPKTLIPDVWAQPQIVVEIIADEISVSPIHTSGFALRFPRMERFRAKEPADTTSVNEIKELHKMQKNEASR